MKISLLFLILLVLSLNGCTANMAGYVEALGKDPANVCIAISTPYGGGVVGRINAPGAKINISGGQCSMETPVSAKEAQ